MKKTLIALALLAGVAAALAVNLRWEPQCLPAEVAASENQANELKQVFEAIRTAYDRNRIATLERFFGLTKREREVLRCTEGVDPVQAGLDLLKAHGRKLELTEVEYIAVEHMPARFYIAGKLNGERAVRFVLHRSGRGFRLQGIVPSPPAE